MNKKVLLSSGHEMPILGLGTWKLTSTHPVTTAITSAITLGYRHIDTALIYENEHDIGTALQSLYQSSTITRKDLFITSKLWNTHHHCPEAGLRQTLSDLQTDYLDCYLIHWPVSFKTDKNGKSIKNADGSYQLTEFRNTELWKKMEEFVDSGRVRSIGIANFGIRNTTEILKSCRIKPAVSQFECHPYLRQEELRSFCKENNIQVVAYSSLGSSGNEEKAPVLLKDPVICRIAEKYQAAPSQIILSSLVKEGVGVIPKSGDKKHQEENMRYVDIKEDDLRDIGRIAVVYRYVNTPSFGPNRFD